MAHGDTRFCKCGCGNPAVRLVNVKGQTKGWFGYARGHAPNEPKDVRIPESVSDLAYAAGIIDGEGCIHAAIRYRDTGTFETCLRLQVGMCSSGVVAWLKEKFGGRTYTDVPMTGHTAYKRRYVWQVSSWRVGLVLRALQPYLIEKKERAVIAIDLAASINPKGYSWTRIPDPERQRRTELAARIKFFNRRTTSEEDQPIELVGNEYKTGYP